MGVDNFSVGPGKKRRSKAQMANLQLAREANQRAQRQRREARESSSTSHPDTFEQLPETSPVSTTESQPTLVPDSTTGDTLETTVPSQPVRVRTSPCPFFVTLLCLLIHPFVLSSLL